MKLSQLSNQELESRLKELVTKERRILHVILEHIREVDTRRLYLERAYSSIYEYLVKELNYSGSAAMRRLEAARLLKDVPAVAQKIQEGSLNLSQIGELSRAIKENEKTKGLKITVVQKENLVSSILGKTTQETQKELALALDIEIQEREKQRTQKNDSVRLEITLSKDQYQMLSRCKDLASHLLEQKQKNSSWASVIEVLADQYLNKKEFATNSRPTAAKAGAAGEPEIEIKSESKMEPKTKQKTEPKMEQKTEPKMEQKTESKVESKSETTSEPKAELKAEPEFSGKPIAASEADSVNKSLTPKVRREILDRDRCCQFRDSLTGRECGSTFKLQIDHRTSQWAGGGHSEDNLQVFCKMHNQMKYRKEAQLRFV